VRRLAALLLLPALLAACSSRAPGANGGGENGSAASPELRLVGVKMRRVAPDGSTGTAEAERAVYSLEGKTVRAEGVTVRIPSGRGEAEIFAPSAEWGTEQGWLRFPGGAEASLGGEFRAVLSTGEVDLPSQTLRCGGEAKLSGPGFSVEGKGLAWDFRGGKGSLGSPRALVAPGLVPGKG
jgi:hypothetical protein